MREREFQGWVIDVAERFGWRVWHVPMPVRPIGGGRTVPEPRAKGLPDLILLHADPPRLVFAEVKGSMGKLSAEQQEFLRLARGVADSGRSDDAGYPHAECPYGPHVVPAVGAYSWRPGQEALVEATLRGKVLS